MKKIQILQSQNKSMCYICQAIGASLLRVVKHNKLSRIVKSRDMLMLKNKFKKQNKWEQVYQVKVRVYYLGVGYLYEKKVTERCKNQ